MATIPPWAYAPEVLRTFGVPRAPIPDHAGARDACTRARAVARVLLLVAPISLPAALEAARAAWAGEYGPAQRAPKTPTGYWAAAAVVLRAATVAPAAEPAEWRPAWSGPHATTAAGAVAVWEVERRLRVAAPTPDAVLDTLYFLYHAALACEPPQFAAAAVRRGLAGRAPAWVRAAVDDLLALLHTAGCEGAPPPRDVFGAYAGVVAGAEGQPAPSSPPPPPGHPLAPAGSY